MTLGIVWLVCLVLTYLSIALIMLREARND